MIQKIEKEDKKYPSLLRKIPDCPLNLFWRGNLNPSIFKNTLAVVGSRRMTSYGKRVAEEIVDVIADQGITIVSGFMYGIDATAHQAAINANGKTIAVMPCGVDVVHPPYQKKLYNQVIEKGLFLSEYENGYLPEKWTYPRRNRIIVGLSQAVLIVEAAEKSGSLITAELALKYKRKLFAVPGSIFSPVSRGTNNLIKIKAAKPTLSARDILSFFRKETVKSKKEKQENENLTEKEKKIIFLLKGEPYELNTISEKTKISVPETSSILSVLEIKGLVKREGLKFIYIKY